MDAQKLSDQIIDLNRLSSDAERAMNAEVAAFERIGQSLVEMVKAHPYLQVTPLGKALVNLDRMRELKP